MHIDICTTYIYHNINKYIQMCKHNMGNIFIYNANIYIMAELFIIFLKIKEKSLK